jgi:hypothetical protein
MLVKKNGPVTGGSAIVVRITSAPDSHQDGERKVFHALWIIAHFCVLGYDEG